MRVRFLLFSENIARTVAGSYQQFYSNFTLNCVARQYCPVKSYLTLEWYSKLSRNQSSSGNRTTLRRFSTIQELWQTERAEGMEVGDEDPGYRCIRFQAPVTALQKRATVGTSAPDLYACARDACRTCAAFKFSEVMNTWADPGWIPAGQAGGAAPPSEKVNIRIWVIELELAEIGILVLIFKHTGRFNVWSKHSQTAYMARKYRRILINRRVWEICICSILLPRRPRNFVRNCVHCSGSTRRVFIQCKTIDCPRLEQSGQPIFICI